jgi:4-hydroxythreonine-4-phosphate dehydrogenase
MAAMGASTDPLVFLGDAEMLRARADMLNYRIDIRVLDAPEAATRHAAGKMQVLHIGCRAPVVPGRLDQRNAQYVLEILREGGTGCLQGRYGALVTAPVHKSIIAASGVAFTGHTEVLAELCGSPLPVMLLTRGSLRVALVTTHLPLREVPDAITAARLRAIVAVLHADLQRLFHLPAPRILVLGLNPHAGEDGALGSEERDIIAPTLEELRAAGIDVVGPRSADTAFTAESLAGFDAVLAMYHDQGLTPLKAQGFGEIVNVTLGLPIIRTSVDHGTALTLAGTGKAKQQSLNAALSLAATLVEAPGKGGAEKAQ